MFGGVSVGLVALSGTLAGNAAAGVHSGQSGGFVPAPSTRLTTVSTGTARTLPVRLLADTSPRIVGTCGGVSAGSSTVTAVLPGTDGPVGIDCTTSPGATRSSPRPAGATTVAPPAADQFANSSMAVTAGSVVSLHWSTPIGASPPSGQYFLVTSAGPEAVPGFGSNSVVAWPPGTAESWNGTWGFWATSANAMSVVIPTTSRAGTTYTVQVYTCSFTTQECSQSPGGTGPVDGTASLTVASGWSAAAYTRDFRTTRVFPEPVGSNPLDVAFSSDGLLWNSSEFSNTLNRIGTAATSAKTFADPSNVTLQPFVRCPSICSASRGQCPERTGHRRQRAHLVHLRRMGWILPFRAGSQQPLRGGRFRPHDEEVLHLSRPWSRQRGGGPGGYGYRTKRTDLVHRGARRRRTSHARFLQSRIDRRRLPWVHQRALHAASIASASGLARQRVGGNQLALPPSHRSDLAFAVGDRLLRFRDRSSRYGYRTGHPLSSRRPRAMHRHQ